ncbi:MAG: hypothetical protein JXR05_03265 [Flavobacteriaceae bacterium]
MYIDVIKELQKHEKDELNEWIMADIEENEIFFKEVVKFSDENPEQIKTYCSNLLPTEDSSLSIVYEALSEYSENWNQFLFEEIKRVIFLAKEKQIKAKCLEVLSDIDSEIMYDKFPDLHADVLDFLTSHLDPNDRKKFNIELLDITFYFLADIEEYDPNGDIQRWIDPILHLINNGDSHVKVKAREIITDLELSIPLPKSTFLENLSNLFKF